MADRIIVIGRFPPPNDGQALATLRLARLLEQCYDVGQVNLEPPNLPVRRTTPLTVSRILHFLRARTRVSRPLADYPDATVVWPSVSPSFFGHFRDRAVVAPAFLPSHRVIAVVHRGDFERLFRRPALKSSAGGLARRIDRFVFLTADLAARCSSWIPNSKRIVIPNTIEDELVFDASEILRTKQERLNRAGPIRVLFVANMIGSKGYLDILESGAHLLEEDRRVELHFVGQWLSESDKDEFHRTANRLKIRDLVIHHGPISERRELKEMYASCDVFVLPTYYENEAQPLSIIEALNAGLPVITTRHAGIPEMVADGAEALFVPRQNPEGIARAIRTLMPKETRIRFSEAARRRYESAYASPRVLSTWVELLDE